MRGRVALLASIANGLRAPGSARRAPPPRAVPLRAEETAFLDAISCPAGDATAAARIFEAYGVVRLRGMARGR